MLRRMEPRRAMPPDVGGDPLRVLFVCTANRARSVYAERRARSLVSGSNVRFVSAGVRARTGEPMETGMAAELRRRGLSDSDHASQPVTGELLASADVVVTFEFSHHMAVLDAWPHVESRVVSFNQLIRGVRSVGDSGDVAEGGALRHAIAASPPDSMALDVEDPYRRGSRFAAACAQEIDAGLEVLVPFFSRVASRLDAASGPTIDPSATIWNAPVSPRRALPEPVSSRQSRWARLPWGAGVRDER